MIHTFDRDRYQSVIKKIRSFKVKTNRVDGQHSWVDLFSNHHITRASMAWNESKRPCMPNKECIQSGYIVDSANSSMDQLWLEPTLPMRWLLDRLGPVNRLQMIYSGTTGVVTMHCLNNTELRLRVPLIGYPSETADFIKKH